MALKVGELFASLNLKDEGFSSGLSEAESAMNGAAKSMQSSSDSIFKGLLKMDIFKKVAGMVMNGAKSVLAVGQSFEATMSGVGALSGAGVEDMQRLEEAAKHYGATTSFSATQAAEAMQYMALAGWDTEKTLAGLPGVLNLAAASGMDLGRASDAITDYLSAFGLAAEDAAGMADMMAYAQAHSNTSAQALSDAYGNCASTMHGAGQDIQTTTAMLMLLADQGLKGSEAGTAMSAVMRDMTQKMENGAIKIGNTAVAVQDAQGNFRDLNDIMADVEAATAGMGSAAKQAALMETFTARSIKAVNMVMTAGTGKLGAYEDALRSATGTGEEQAGKMLDNLQGDIKLFQSAMEGLQLELYDGVSEIARDMVHGGSEIVQALLEGVQSGFDNASLDKLLGGSFNLMDAIGKNIRKGIRAMPKFFSDLGKLAGPFAKHLIGMAGEAVGTFVASLPELAPALLEGFINLFAGVTSGLTEAFKGIFLAMTGQLDKGELGLQLGEAMGVDIDTGDAEAEIEGAKRTMTQGLHDALEYVRRTFTGEVEGDSDSMANAATKLVNEKLAGLYGQVGEWEQSKIAEIQSSDLGADEMAAAIEGVSAQADEMRARLASSRGEAEAWLDTYSGMPADIVNEHYNELEGILDGVSDVEKVTSEYAQAVGDSVEEQSLGEQIFEHLFGDVDLSSVTEVFSNLGQTIGDAINTGFTAAGIGTTGIINMITSGLDTITSEDFNTQAEAVATHVITAIGNGFTNVVNKTTTLVVQIINGLSTALGKITAGGPELTSTGESVAGAVFDAIIKGIESLENGAIRIVNALGGLLGQALDSMNDEDFVAGLTSLGTTIIQGIGESLRKAGEAGVSIMDAITSVINEQLTPDKISGALTNIGNFIQGIWDAISGEMTKEDEGGRTLLDAFVDMVGAAFNSLTDDQVLTAVGDLGTKILTALGRGIKSAFTKASEIVDAITEMIRGAMQGADGTDLTGSFIGLGTQIVSALGEAIKLAAGGAATLISSIGELISTLISSAFGEAADETTSGDAQSVFAGLGSTLVTGISSALTAVGDAGGQIWSAISGLFEGQDWASIGSAVWEKIKGGITATGDWLKTQLGYQPSDEWSTIGRSLWNKIKTGISATGDWLKTLLGYSPSDGWIQVGKNVWAKIKEGISTGLETLKTNLGELSNNETIGKLQTALDGVLTTAEGIASSIADAYSKLMENGTLGDIWTSLGGIVGNIADIIGTLTGAIFGVGEDVSKALSGDGQADPESNPIVKVVQAISTAMQGMETALGWLADALKTLDEWGGLVPIVEGLGAAVASYFTASAVSNVVAFFKAFGAGGSVLAALNPEIAALAAFVAGLVALAAWARGQIKMEDKVNTDYWDSFAFDNIYVALDAYKDAETAISEAMSQNVTGGLFSQEEANAVADLMRGYIDQATGEFDTQGWHDTGVEAAKELVMGMRGELGGSGGLETGLSEELESTKAILEQFGFGEDVSGATEGAKAEAEAAMAELDALASQYGDSGENAGLGYGEGMAGTDLSSYASTLTSSGVDAVNSAQSASSPAQLFVPAGEYAAAGYGEGMANYDISPAARTLATSARQAVIQAWPSSTIQQIGRYFAQGLANGIRAGKSAVIQAAAEVASAAIKKAKATLQENSPSKVTTEMGEFFSQGFANGITNGLNAVRTVASNMAATASGALNQGVQSRSAALAGTSAATANAPGFDYDRLETIVRGLNLVMVANDKAIAQVTARQNKIQSDNEAKRLALATGRR